MNADLSHAVGRIKRPCVAGLLSFNFYISSSLHFSVEGLFSLIGFSYSLIYIVLLLCVHFSS